MPRRLPHAVCGAGALAGKSLTEHTNVSISLGFFLVLLQDWGLGSRTTGDFIFPLTFIQFCAREATGRGALVTHTAAHLLRALPISYYCRSAFRSCLLRGQRSFLFQSLTGGYGTSRRVGISATSPKSPSWVFLRTGLGEPGAMALCGPPAWICGQPGVWGRWHMDNRHLSSMVLEAGMSRSRNRRCL